ncbi:EamA family transporter [Domibacillus epiphyticus]|uniref:EamA family transporter n=2 Tax=Domibacillus epiphyticus TaxID=1714355 RepID=A0A1V2AAZ7_9BACI|nr:EamA family transporter [Domibacillus epiphyticus]
MIVLISLIWGYLWVTVKIGLEAMPPFFFSSARLLIGGFVLFLFLLVKRQEILPRKDEWAPFFYLSLLMCIGYYAFSTYGMQFVDSGLSSVLVYTMPIIITLLAHFFLDEHLTLNKVIGLVAGAIGLLFIMGPHLLHLSWNLSLLGELIILLSAFFWAWASIYTKKIGHAHDKVKMTMWQLLMGGFFIFIISLGTEHEAIAGIALSKSSIFALLYNGILGSAVAFVGWNWVLGKIQASTASISLMSVPLLGLFFGWLQLGEEMTGNILIGAVFICLGILFTSIQVKSKNYIKAADSSS